MRNNWRVKQEKLNINLSIATGPQEALFSVKIKKIIIIIILGATK